MGTGDEDRQVAAFHQSLVLSRMLKSAAIGCGTPHPIRAGPGRFGDG